MTTNHHVLSETQQQQTNRQVIAIWTNPSVKHSAEIIDRNKSIKFAVCKCYWSGVLWLSACERNEKTTFKDM